jgi:hypothetical protein
MRVFAPCALAIAMTGTQAPGRAVPGEHQFFKALRGGRLPAVSFLKAPG